MSFTVGLLEMVGYLVPGATVVGAWLWLMGRLPPASTSEMAGPTGLALALLASYVVGQLLTFVSSILRPKRRPQPYINRQQFKAPFEAMFGRDVLEGAKYHLARALVIHRSPGLAERVERYFALVILSRNLTVAFAVVAVLLVISGHRVWAVAWGAAALAFWRQHERFANTESNAVFGAAFVVMGTAPTAPSPAGPPDDRVTAGQDGER